MISSTSLSQLVPLTLVLYAGCQEGALVSVRDSVGWDDDSWTQIRWVFWHHLILNPDCPRYLLESGSGPWGPISHWRPSTVMFCWMEKTSWEPVNQFARQDIDSTLGNDDQFGGLFMSRWSSWLNLWTWSMVWPMIAPPGGCRCPG